jgi:hypothetical protein
MVRSHKQLPQQDVTLHPSAVQEAQDGACQTHSANFFATVPAQKELVLMGSQVGTRIIKE